MNLLIGLQLKLVRLMIIGIYNPILQYYMWRSAKTNEICKYVIKNKSSGLMILYWDVMIKNEQRVNIFINRFSNIV